MLWGERKEGKPVTLTDYELKLWGGGSGIMYIEPAIGESVVCKSYSLNYEQLLATDAYEGESYKRIKVKTPDNKEIVWVYVKA